MKVFLCAIATKCTPGAHTSVIGINAKNLAEIKGGGKKIGFLLNNLKINLVSGSVMAGPATSVRGRSAILITKIDAFGRSAVRTFVRINRLFLNLFRCPHPPSRSEY